MPGIMASKSSPLPPQPFLHAYRVSSVLLHCLTLESNHIASLVTIVARLELLLMLVQSSILFNWYLTAGLQLMLG